MLLSPTMTAILIGWGKCSTLYTFQKNLLYFYYSIDFDWFCRINGSLANSPTPAYTHSSMYASWMCFPKIFGLAIFIHKCINTESKEEIHIWVFCLVFLLHYIYLMSKKCSIKKITCWPSNSKGKKSNLKLVYD